ncbi:hypothetical protein [Streptomyces sp. Go-475]|uniref:dihydrodipicolinate synthase family protein n=1 Tax=Streptomyces sp. Go-475 TaxID=2072505 RepID=UPI000DF08828|nr:hypothetical protein [Streptomyces sp. Go-475]AXE83815.1 hypothetical protein C1703_02315 [Streptomyces sp. Go-475]
MKLPPVPGDPAAARRRVAALRALLPETVAVGVSGDWAAATGLNAGCDTWYSVLGGLFPRTALALTRAALSGDAEGAVTRSTRLEPLWELFRRYGGLRVMSAAAAQLGLAAEPNLPLPLRGLPTDARRRLVTVLDDLELGTTG